MFKCQITLDRHGLRPLPDVCLIPSPSCFSLRSTLKLEPPQYVFVDFGNKNIDELFSELAQILKTVSPHTESTVLMTFTIKFLYLQIF
jgi:hypothetical protein